MEQGQNPKAKWGWYDYALAAVLGPVIVGAVALGVWNVGLFILDAVGR